MQQILVIAGAVLLALKDTLSNIKLSKQTKTIILLVVAYFVFNNFLRNEQKKAALDTAGTDVDTNFAIRLYNAFHPVIDWGFWLPDGTNEAEIEAVAKEMRYFKNYAAVSQKYRTLYGRELTTDLSDEGVYNLFFQYYR